MQPPSPHRSPTPSSPTTATPLSNTSRQQLLDAVEQAKLREKRLLLSLQGEAMERSLTRDIDDAAQAVERARAAAEELERKRKEAELQRRNKLKEEEERKKAKEEKKR